jgi:(E)-4-hydroxy-3-methylbut-2-enyl-diphosphate synthase
MKASNPQVMVQAYRLLINKMHEEFGDCYPLHLGVTEAGDGEDGRIKSAIGIGSLLEDGIGDTIRVSLTEDPELELPVCRDIVKRYADASEAVSEKQSIGFDPFHYHRRQSFEVGNIGGHHVPVVIADLSSWMKFIPIVAGSWLCIRCGYRQMAYF